MRMRDWNEKRGTGTSQEEKKRNTKREKKKDEEKKKETKCTDETE